MNGKIDDIWEEMKRMVDQPLPALLQYDMFYHQAAMHVLLTSLLLSKGLVTETDLLHMFTKENIEEAVKKLKAQSPISPETTQTN